MTMNNRNTSLQAALAVMGTACVVHGQTRVVYVDQSAPAGGDGSSWQAAFNDLQIGCTAINALPAMDDDHLEIRIAQGTYRPNGAVGYNEPAFQLHPHATASGGTLTILGAFGGLRSTTPDVRDYVSTPTILSGDVLGDDGPEFLNRADNAGLVLSVYWYGEWFVRELTLDGLTIRGGGRPGVFEGGGASITTNGFSSRVQRCRFEGNVGSSLSTASGAWIGAVSSVFIGNRSSASGGAINARDGCTVFDCTFRDNFAANEGGAISVTSRASGYGILGVTFSTFEGNASGSAGGALSASGPPILVSNSLFAGNRSGEIGGAIASSESCYVVNSTLVENGAPWASALLSLGGFVLENSIVCANHGSIDARPVAGIRRSGELRNTMIEGGLDGILLTLGADLTLADRGVLQFDPGFVDPDGTDGDPATVADNDYKLSPRSPAVDAGRDRIQYTIDRTGNPRVVAGVFGRPPAPDLGCYESQVTLCPADIDADQGISVADLVEFLAAFEAGGYLGDVTGNGTTPDSDGAVTIDDLLYFLARFELGC